MTTISSNDDLYTSNYPQDLRIDPDIKAIIKHYYKQVDTKGRHVEYSECFAEDGVLIAPSGKLIRGREAIKDVHQGMWEGLPKRLHRPIKIYPFGTDANEVIIIGTVEYWPDEKPYVKKDMAARAEYQRNVATNKIEISRLQVWLTP